MRHHSFAKHFYFVFNFQQLLTKIAFVIFDIVVKKIECVLEWSVLLSRPINNDTRHHSGQNLLWTHSVAPRDVQNILTTVMTRIVVD